MLARKLKQEQGISVTLAGRNCTYSPRRQRRKFFSSLSKSLLPSTAQMIWNEGALGRALCPSGGGVFRGQRRGHGPEDDCASVPVVGVAPVHGGRRETLVFVR